MTRKVFDPEKMCGAARRSTDEDGTGHKGDPCRLPKGYRTDHLGSGHCHLHGGMHVNGKIHAVRERAAKALALLGEPIVKNPDEALLELVWNAAGREFQLRLDYQAAKEQKADQEAAVILGLWNDERDRLAKIAKMAVDAGLEERRVRLAERQVDFLQRVIETALDAAGVDDDGRSRALEAAAREIRIALPAGDSDAPPVRALLPAGVERN